MARDEAYWREWYEERAAILEYDGEWPRMVAQRLARGELKAARAAEERNPNEENRR